MSHYMTYKVLNVKILEKQLSRRNLDNEAAMAGQITSWVELTALLSQSSYLGWSFELKQNSFKGVLKQVERFLLQWVLKSYINLIFT